VWVPDKIFGFSDCAAQSAALASAASAAHEILDVHKFPDGESRVRVVEGANRAAIFRPLHHPNEKLVEIILASSALRDQGATEVALLAPYLPYMRQDIAFQPGEAVSQKVIGDLLAGHFDRFLSVDPHLHRTPTLSAVFQGKPSLCVTAASAIADHITTHADREGVIIVGPDIESEPLARAVASPLKAPWLVAAKTRHGDRDVDINLPNQMELRGRPAIIVDDVISSGATIVGLAQLLSNASVSSIDVYTTHALFGDQAHQSMKAAGTRTVISCDSIPHPTNAISLANALAEGLKTWR
jgi:ribose-phosphate pyrophosphokinase